MLAERIFINDYSGQQPHELVGAAIFLIGFVFVRFIFGVT